MGGHGHGHEPPYKIPSPDIYKVEDVPDLKRYQEQLAKEGLKDPWLRNVVWRYQLPGTPVSRACTVLFRGSKIGIPAFLLTIAAEQYFGIDYHGHADHHGDDHSHH